MPPGLPSGYYQPLRIMAAVDPICPLSFLGVRLVQHALETSPWTAMTSDKRLFRPYWLIQPYQIDAALPSDMSVPKRHVYRSLFEGGFTREMEDKLIADGKQHGINFNFDGSIRNSTTDFRLLMKVKDKVDGRASMDFLEDLFSHHLEKSGDTGQPADLINLALKHGTLGPGHYKDFVQGTEYQTKFLKQLLQVPKLKIGRSPTFYFSTARVARGNPWRAFRGVTSVKDIVDGIADLKHSFDLKVDKIRRNRANKSNNTRNAKGK